MSRSREPRGRGYELDADREKKEECVGPARDVAPRALGRPLGYRERPGQPAVGSELSSLARFSLLAWTRERCKETGFGVRITHRITFFPAVRAILAPLKFRSSHRK